MAGPTPVFCPVFPVAFLEEARSEVRRKTAQHRCVQRYQLALLVHEHPEWNQEELGRRVGLCGHQVHHWRKRWAKGDFSVADGAGRGRKPGFFPSGRRGGQSLGL